MKSLIDLRIPDDIPKDELPYLLEHWYLGSAASRHMSQRRFALVDAHLGDRVGGPVLDVGCGWGFNVFYLQSLGHRAVGIDLAWDSFPAARRIAAANRFEAAFTQADVSRLPFADGSFGAVTSVETWEHVYEADRARALAEVYRVLRPGGAFVLSTPNARGLVEVGKRVGLRLPLLGRRLPSMMMVPAGEIARDGYHPYRYHRPEDPARLRRALEEAGFGVEVLTYGILVLRGTPAWLLRPAFLFESIVEKIPYLRNMASTLVVRARRPLEPPS